MPQRTWMQLSTVLAFLLIALVRHTSSANINTNNENNPSKQYDPGNDEQYEVIDVAKQQQQLHGNDNNSSNNKQIQTGQTTRIFTTGEVDDDFWLKHLGEDFKYAIHLQVGGNEQYDGIYNMTEDGSIYKAQPQYGPIANKPEMDENKPNDIAVDYSTERGSKMLEEQVEKRTSDNNSTREEQQKTNRNNKDQEEPAQRATSDQTTIQQASTKTTDTNNRNAEKYEAPFEHIFTIGDAGMKFFSPNKFGLGSEKYKRNDNSQSDKYRKYRKLQRVNRKYMKSKSISSTTKPTISAQHSEIDADTDSMTVTESNSKASIETDTDNDVIITDTSKNKKYFKIANDKYDYEPIVVNLTETQKTIHHLDDSELPVIVKMPPVIYHGSPTYTQLEEIEGEEDQQKNSAMEDEATTDEQNKANPQEYTNTHTNSHTNTHTNSNTNTDYTNNETKLQTQVDTNPHTLNAQQLEPHQEEQPIHTTQDTHHHKQFFEQQQHQRALYPPYISATNFYNQPSNAQASTAPIPISPYEASAYGNSESIYQTKGPVLNESPFSSLTRISRSNRDLFEQGL